MNIKKGMKLFEAFYNDDKDAYIKEWAIDDWETGQTFDPDDFDYFRKVAADGGYKVNQADFDYYFECIDECREKEYYNEEELEESFNKEIVYKGYHIINDKEYSGGYIITDKDGDDVTPGHIFKSIKDAKKEIDAGVAFPLNESYDKTKLLVRLYDDEANYTSPFTVSGDTLEAALIKVIDNCNGGITSDDLNGDENAEELLQLIKDNFSGYPFDHIYEIKDVNTNKVYLDTENTDEDTDLSKIRLQVRVTRYDEYPDAESFVASGDTLKDALIEVIDNCDGYLYSSDLDGSESVEEILDLIRENINGDGCDCVYYLKNLNTNEIYIDDEYIQDQEETIPEGTTIIKDYAFDGCTNLTNITLPNSVTKIGGWAFHNCINITSITIPDSVTIIGNGAFSRCTNLKKIIIPNSVTNIGDYAFDNCNNLTIYTKNEYVIKYCKENNIRCKES